MLTSPDFAELRAREFARLDLKNIAYLDYTGAALHAASQVQDHHAALLNDVYGNPHADHDPSRTSDMVTEAARADVLALLGVDDRTHTVIFTANASAAIKLVAESFPFTSETPLILAADNHNSVNGIREYARRAGAPVVTLPLDATLRLDHPADRLGEACHGAPGLLAFPAQSNFSGVQHDLALVAEARRRGCLVLLDAAAFLPTNALDLRQVPADFVALSFYKLFGYPTGIGALVARLDALSRLTRPWFSGGTVDFVSIAHDRHQLRRGHASFEDGTPDFLGMSAVSGGLRFLTGLGIDAIHRHTRVHARAFLNAITHLSHANGSPLVEVYGPDCADDRGATVAFNVKDDAGRTVPYPLVERRAGDFGVALRGGCFCNPGAAEAAFRFDAAETARCLTAVGDDFTIERFASCLGDFSTVGALRASFGVPTNARDVTRAIALVESFRMGSRRSRGNQDHHDEHE
jgi:selenocysteine lyase/cysteine desulfurase